MLRTFATLSLLFTLGCATTSASFQDGWFVRSVKVPVEGGEQRMTVRWTAGLPADGWKQAPDRAGDFSYWNEALGATMYGDSTCGERFDDVPLTVLANHLFFGFDDVRTEREEALELSGRAGLRRVASGTLDGVPVRIGAAIVKKGPCVFDLTLVAPPARFADAEPDWIRFVDGFDARIDR